MGMIMRSACVLAATFLLSACLVTPGRFESSLDIRADGRFNFSYKGEILASDMTMPGDNGDPLGNTVPGQQDSAYGKISLRRDASQRSVGKDADPGGDDAQMREIASRLSKEKGFSSVRYMGDHKFEIDYAIGGTLDHAFLFPFNIDAQIILPFVAVELRGEDRLRVKAPGFANSFGKSQGPVMDGSPDDAAAKALNGTFTLTTDAEIISQNDEDGAQDTPQGKRITWTITPMTSDAPTATLRLKR